MTYLKVEGTICVSPMILMDFSEVSLSSYFGNVAHIIKDLNIKHFYVIYSGIMKESFF